MRYEHHLRYPVHWRAVRGLFCGVGYVPGGWEALMSEERATYAPEVTRKPVEIRLPFQGYYLTFTPSTPVSVACERFVQKYGYEPMLIIRDTITQNLCLGPTPAESEK